MKTREELLFRISDILRRSGVEDAEVLIAALEGRDAPDGMNPERKPLRTALVAAREHAKQTGFGIILTRVARTRNEAAAFTVVGVPLWQHVPMDLEQEPRGDYLFRFHDPVLIAMDNAERERRERDDQAEW